MALAWGLGWGWRWRWGGVTVSEKGGCEVSAKVVGDGDGVVSTTGAWASASAMAKAWVMALGMAKAWVMALGKEMG